MKRFVTFANSVEQSKQVGEESFSSFRNKMKVAVNENAVHRRKAIQSASKVILTQ